MRTYNLFFIICSLNIKIKGKSGFLFYDIYTYCLLCLMPFPKGGVQTDHLAYRGSLLLLVKEV